jgi:hypothetical protein
MDKYTSSHLTEDQRLKLGGFYTIRELVRIVGVYIKPFIEAKRDVIIVDSAAGRGAFEDLIDGNDYRFADCDEFACQFLTGSLQLQKVFHCNALHHVCREMFNIPADAFVIQVGNPPYNDTTSEFRKGGKGENRCDVDLFDRDLGISFLKSYDKLKADVVCVLHPLSYLVKEANFKRLKGFRENYALKRAVVFPSSLFSGTGSIKFPIMIGLYERSPQGMDFDSISRFEFPILGGGNKFVLGRYETIDGYINKYPPRSCDPKTSSLGLYYYTIRDINALRKNASFLTRLIPNGIVVEADNFYRYAYLHAFKIHFAPEDAWLYGNLSPLVDRAMLERSKRVFVAYALLTNSVLKGLSAEVLEKITAFYNLDLTSFVLDELEKEVKLLISGVSSGNSVRLQIVDNSQSSPPALPARQRSLKRAPKAPSSRFLGVPAAPRTRGPTWMHRG